MIIVGVDEVGRGCWAGPLVAGAVALPADMMKPQDEGWRLADSKVLSRIQRERSAVRIHETAIAYGLGWVTSAEVDSYGLTEAVRLAMRRAMQGIGVSYDEIVVDGSINYLASDPRAQALVKADASVPAVSAASIIAKVARDDWMRDVAKRYPEYGFERHVGYGTKQHIEALRVHGVTDIHRKSYAPIRAMLQ